MHVIDYAVTTLTKTHSSCRSPRRPTYRSCTDVPPLPWYTPCSRTLRWESSGIRRFSCTLSVTHANESPTTIPVADVVGVPGTGHVASDVEETTFAHVLDGLTTLRVSRDGDVFVGSTH